MKKARRIFNHAAKKKVVDAYLNAVPPHVIKTKYGVSDALLYRWLRQFGHAAKHSRGESIMEKVGTTDQSDSTDFHVVLPIECRLCQQAGIRKMIGSKTAMLSHVKYSHPDEWDRMETMPFTSNDEKLAYIAKGPAEEIAAPVDTPQVAPGDYREALYEAINRLEAEKVRIDEEKVRIDERISKIREFIG